MCLAFSRWEKVLNEEKRMRETHAITSSVTFGDSFSSRRSQDYRGNYESLSSRFKTGYGIPWLGLV